MPQEHRALESFFTDLLDLKDWESFYLKRDWDRYVGNIQSDTWYWFCTLSIWEALIKLIK